MIARIESALAFVSSDERDTWLMAGMAIKNELGESGFDLWDSWSRESESYNSQSAKSVWRSIRNSGKITLGSLFHEAKSSGWRDNGIYEKPNQLQINERKRLALVRETVEGKTRELAHQAAAKKAGWIMHQCKSEQHAYLDSKGFKDELGRVWWVNDGDNLLCIPMYINAALVGVQLINRTGEKKFLTGQRTSGAYHLINNDGYGSENWFIEGYASGLSLLKCLKSMKLRYKIYICFSAHNMKNVALSIGSGYCIADCDKSETGERAAIESGLPYWMPFDDDTDINDFYKENGLFRTSQVLKKWINLVKSK